MSQLPKLAEGQDWCCGGCGSGIVKPKQIAFEYSREEFPDGRVISKTVPHFVAPCCGGELLLWDEGKEDFVEWDYVQSATQDGSAKTATAEKGGE